MHCKGQCVILVKIIIKTASLSTLDVGKMFSLSLQDVVKQARGKTKRLLLDFQNYPLMENSSESRSATGEPVTTL